MDGKARAGLLRAEGVDVGALLGPLGRWFGVGLVGLALVAGLLWFRSEAHDARAAAATHKAAAEESAKTLAMKTADEKLATKLVGDYAAEIAKLQEDARVERTSIATAPATTSCADSPAVRRLLDGLR